MVDRVAAVRKREDERAESGVGELRQGDRLGVDVAECQCQRIQFGLGWTLVERGKRALRIRPGRQRQDGLREEPDPAGAKVARRQCVILCDDLLDLEIPLQRVGQVLVRDVGRSKRASRLLVELVRPLIGTDTAGGAAEFRTVLVLEEGELGHRLIRHIYDSPGDALVVVVDAFDHKIVITGPLAADRRSLAQAGASAGSDARALQREVQHAQGQVGARAVERLTGIEGVSDHRRGGVDLAVAAVTSTSI